MASTEFAAKPPGTLVPKSKDYILMVILEKDTWIFHPTYKHLIQGRVTLIFMTKPDERDT